MHHLFSWVTIPPEQRLDSLSPDTSFLKHFLLCNMHIPSWFGISQPDLSRALRRVLTHTVLANIALLEPVSIC